MTEAGCDCDVVRLAPYTQHVLISFGAERAMWGSDWPVVNFAADYRTWPDVAQRLLAGASVAEQAMIFGGTAAAFYGVEKDETVT